MKTTRERFVKTHKKEYQQVPGKGLRKKIVYTGDYYTWTPEKGSIESTRKLFLILEILTIIIFGISSIPGTVISYSNITIGAAILSFVVWAFEAFGVFSFCLRKLPLQEDDYAYTKWSFRIGFPLRFVLLIVSVVTGFIYMSDKGYETSSILALIGYLITALIAAFLFFTFIKLSKYETVIPGDSST